MRDYLLIAFILALPALTVLGHDIWMAYNNTHLEPGERFYLSDLGWLWVKYSPASYDWMVENTDAFIWNNVIDPLLKRSALYISAVPLALYAVITTIMKVFGLGSFEGEGVLENIGSKRTKKGDFTFSGGGNKKKTKYKRK